MITRNLILGSTFIRCVLIGPGFAPKPSKCLLHPTLTWSPYPRRKRARPLRPIEEVGDVGLSALMLPAVHVANNWHQNFVRSLLAPPNG